MQNLDTSWSRWVGGREMQLDPATVAERLTISAAECSNAAETCDMTPLAALVPSDHLIKHLMQLFTSRKYST